MLTNSLVRRLGCVVHDGGFSKISGVPDLTVVVQACWGNCLDFSGKLPKKIISIFPDHKLQVHLQVPPLPPIDKLPPPTSTSLKADLIGPIGSLVMNSYHNDFACTLVMI